MNGFTPERIRPFPKAAPRKNTGQRKKRKSTVLTDTPEKIALEAAFELKKMKNKRSAKIQLKLIELLIFSRYIVIVHPKTKILFIIRT